MTTQLTFIKIPRCRFRCGLLCFVGLQCGLQLLEKRVERQRSLDDGGTLDFLDETREVRDGDWQVGGVEDHWRHAGLAHDRVGRHALMIARVAHLGCSARTTVAEGGQHDVVTHLDTGDGGPDLGDHPGALLQEWCDP